MPFLLKIRVVLESIQAKGNQQEFVLFVDFQRSKFFYPDLVKL